jgi:ribosomal protein S18 acetylase RimI-like enzyme
MIPDKDLELRESNELFIGSASRICANFPGGEVTEMPGLIAAWCNTAIPFLNAIFLSRPVMDGADLERRAAALSEYIKVKEKPPLFLACQEWIPGQLREAAGALFTEAGLSASITITGMATDELLPRRIAPGLEYRRVGDKETRHQLADINAAVYGFSIEAGREALAATEIWSNDFAGYVGCLEGRAVTAAATMAIQGSLHVMCVATLPECQRRGYAEAAMRYSLEDVSRSTGLTRTTLHATDAGRPVYQSMGYHQTANFIGYTRQSQRVLRP